MNIKPIVVPEVKVRKLSPLRNTADGKEATAQDFIDEANNLLAGNKPSIIVIGAKYTKFEGLKQERRALRAAAKDNVTKNQKKRQVEDISKAVGIGQVSKQREMAAY